MSFLDATVTTILNHYQVTLLLPSEPDTSAVDAASKKITKHFELHVGRGTWTVSVALIANLAHSYFASRSSVGWERFIYCLQTLVQSVDQVADAFAVYE